jgi:hypothetical protein
MLPKRYLALASGRCGSVDELASRLQSLTPAESREHVQAMFRILRTRKYATDLNTRIGAINVVLALPHDSLRTLWRLVRHVSTPTSYEVAFTLFLSLYSGDSKFKLSYIELAEWYLMRVKSKRGSAAFEAAHYLGSSCDDWAGVESLFRVIRNGKSLVGRTEALQGLAYALRRQTTQRRRKILNFLKARTKDPNKQVRWHAEFVLKYAESL